MKSKKILFLGAANHQLSPIKHAKEKGYHILTLDNNIHNPGHKLADRSFNLDTKAVAKVLIIAKQEQIDGVMSYASDVSAYTRSFVCNEMDLPGAENDLEGINILTNKYRFRDFLAKHGIQKMFYAAFRLDQLDEAVKILEQPQQNLIVKPVDASGSRGVMRIDRHTNINEAIQNAFLNSSSQQIIIEEYITKSGNQICGDGFMLDNRLAFIQFGDGLLTENQVPYAELFPSSHDEKVLKNVEAKLEQVLQLIGFKRGVFNFDVLVTETNEVFINEIGPRSGGNYIPEAIHLNTAVNMVEVAVESAIDKNYRWNFTPQLFDQGYFACYVIHSESKGLFKGIEIDHSIRAYIYDLKQFVQKGALVDRFLSGNKAVGHAILRFENESEMRLKMEHIRDLIKVITTEENGNS